MLATFIDKHGHECTVKLESTHVYNTAKPEHHILTRVWFGDLYLLTCKDMDVDSVLETCKIEIERFDIRNEGIEHG